MDLMSAKFLVSYMSRPQHNWKIPNSMDIWYPCFMQKPFVTQAELFVSSSDLEHPALHAFDDTEAVLDLV